MVTPRVVALVPMRHSSERVSGKNYRPFAGRPLYWYIVSSLLDCPSIAEVVIDTDSPTIHDAVSREFPQVRLLHRPQHLRDGRTPMNEVLLHDVNSVDADFYVQTHSTNPLLRPQTIEAAIAKLISSFPEYDSLFSVTRVQTRLWDLLVRPINHNPAILLPTQDMPPVFEENSNLYIFRRETLEKCRNRIGERPLMFEIDRVEAWDIDEELDFEIAEFLYQKRTDKG